MAARGGVGRLSWWAVIRGGSVLKVGLLHDLASGQPRAEVTGLHRLESETGEPQVVQAVRELPLSTSPIVLLVALVGSTGIGEFLAIDAATGCKLQRWCGMPLAAAPDAVAVEDNVTVRGELKCAVGCTTGEVQLYNLWFDCTQAEAAAGAAGICANEKTTLPFPWRREHVASLPQAAVTSLLWVCQHGLDARLAVGWANGEFGLLRAQDGLVLGRCRATASGGSAVTLLAFGPELDDDASDAGDAGSALGHESLWVAARDGASLWRLGRGAPTLLLQLPSTHGSLRQVHPVTRTESVLLFSKDALGLPVAQILSVVPGEDGELGFSWLHGALPARADAGSVYMGSWTEPVSAAREPRAAPLLALLRGDRGIQTSAELSFSGWLLTMASHGAQADFSEPALVPIGHESDASIVLDAIEEAAPDVFAAGSSSPGPSVTVKLASRQGESIALADACVAVGLADSSDPQTALVQATLFGGLATLLCEHIATCSVHGRASDMSSSSQRLSRLVTTELSRTRDAVETHCREHVWASIAALSPNARAVSAAVVSPALAVSLGAELIFGALRDRADLSVEGPHLAQAEAEARAFSLTLKATLVVLEDGALCERFLHERLASWSAAMANASPSSSPASGESDSPLLLQLIRRAALKPTPNRGEGTTPSDDVASLFLLPQHDSATRGGGDDAATAWRACAMLYGLLDLMCDVDVDTYDEANDLAAEAARRFGSALEVPRDSRALVLGFWSLDRLSAPPSTTAPSPAGAKSNALVRAHAQELCALRAVVQDPDLLFAVARAILGVSGDVASERLADASMMLGLAQISDSDRNDRRVTRVAIEAVLKSGHLELAFSLLRDGDADESALVHCFEWLWSRKQLHDLLVLPLGPRQELALLRFLSERFQRGEAAAKPTLVAWLLERGRIVDAVGAHQHLRGGAGAETRTSKGRSLDEFEDALIENYERLLPPALRAALGDAEHTAPVVDFLRHISSAAPAAPVRADSVGGFDGADGHAANQAHPPTPAPAPSLLGSPTDLPADACIGASLWTALPEATAEVLTSPAPGASRGGAFSSSAKRRVSQLRTPPVQLSYLSYAPRTRTISASETAIGVDDGAPDGFLLSPLGHDEAALAEETGALSPAAASPAAAAMSSGAMQRTVDDDDELPDSETRMAAMAAPPSASRRSVSFAQAHDQASEATTPVPPVIPTPVGTRSARRSGAPRSGARSLMGIDSENIIQGSRTRRSRGGV